MKDKMRQWEDSFRAVIRPFNRLRIEAGRPSNFLTGFHNFAWHGGGPGKDWKSRRTMQSTLPPPLSLLLFLRFYTTWLQIFHARYDSMRRNHRNLWGMINETLSRHSTDKKTVHMTQQASPGAPKGPQVDRELYDAPCDWLHSHIRSVPHLKSQKDDCYDGSQLLTLNATLSPQRDVNAKGRK